MIKTLLTAVLASSITTTTFAQIETKPSEPAPQNEKKTAELNKPAPSFSLQDQHGVTHTLEQYKGKVVVLEWFNETCPYCKATWGSGLVQKLLSDLNDLDTEVVYLAINSTANRPEEDVVLGGKEFLEELELEVDVPILNDYEGTVGHLYKARTTPHMYVIDTEGVLVYQGALSDDKRSKEGDQAETHVLRAVQQIEAGEEVSPNYVQPWGCGVKYAGGKGTRGRRGGGPMGRPKPGSK